MIGVSLAQATLSAQVIGTVDTSDIGKAVALVDDWNGCAFTPPTSLSCSPYHHSFTPILRTRHPVHSSQYMGAIFLPLISAYMITWFGYSSICYVNAAVSFVAVFVVHFTGTFMRYSNQDFLPGFS
jgi:hypothetical protein